MENKERRQFKSSPGSELKRQKFIDICERYKSDDPEVKQKALEDAIKEMEGFIHETIKKKYSTYGKYYEDLVQEGKIGIIQGMKKNYDPTQTLPTTYFNVYIIHEISKFIDEMVNKTSSHYASHLTKINKAINKFEQEDRKWNAQDIAVETGIKMETIIQCLAINEYKKEVRIDSEDVDVQIRETSKSPEEKYIENEQMRSLYLAIADLSPVEREVIIKKYGLGPEGVLAYKTISEEMNIPVEQVKKVRHEAIRKLRDSRKVKSAFRGYEKANENNMLNSGTISLIPEEVASSLMAELENVELEFSDME